MYWAKEVVFAETWSPQRKKIRKFRELQLVWCVCSQPHKGRERAKPEQMPMRHERHLQGLGLWHWLRGQPSEILKQDGD